MIVLEKGKEVDSVVCGQGALYVYVFITRSAIRLDPGSWKEKMRREFELAISELEKETLK